MVLTTHNKIVTTKERDLLPSAEPTRDALSLGNWENCMVGQTNWAHVSGSCSRERSRRDRDGEFLGGPALCASHSWVPPHSDFIYLKEVRTRKCGDFPKMNTWMKHRSGLCYSTPHSPLVPVSESHSRITQANRSKIRTRGGGVPNPAPTGFCIPRRQGPYLCSVPLCSLATHSSTPGRHRAATGLWVMIGSSPWCPHSHLRPEPDCLKQHKD